MDVILMKDVDTLGAMGDIVKVKDGFARNFLIPQKKAVVCSKANRRLVEEHKRLFAAKLAKEKEKFEALAEKIAAVSCTIRVQVGEDDKLYGSVTNADVHDALLNEGIDIDKRKIELVAPIKELGVFSLNVKLHPEVTAALKVWVIKQ